MNQNQNEHLLNRGLYIITKMTEAQLAKRLIADYVVDKYVSNFDAVLLDAGSTAEIIAEKMFVKRKFLSVLTNNMGAYAAYTRASKPIEANSDVNNIPNHGNELLITGGRYVDIYESLLGEGAISSIENFAPNVIIIGTSGITCEGGIFCHGSEESAVKKLLWNKPTDTRLIATDWTKIGKIDARSFGTISEFHVNAKKAVIVTSEPPRELCAKEPERVKEFENQLAKMKREFHIIVERIPSNKIDDGTMVAINPQKGQSESPQQV